MIGRRDMDMPRVVNFVGFVIWMFVLEALQNQPLLQSVSGPLHSADAADRNHLPLGNAFTTFAHQLVSRFRDSFDR